MKPVLRGAGAVFAGYAAIFMTISLIFSLAYMLMGPDRAFEPGTFDVSLAWIQVVLVANLGAAVLGGKVCHLIDRTVVAAICLVALVAVLGAIQLVVGMNVEPVEQAMRIPGEPALVEAAVQPLWILIVSPIIQMIGVAWGSGNLRISAWIKSQKSADST